MTFCTNCGQLIESGKFCTNCGAPVPQPVAKPAPSPGSPVSAASASSGQGTYPSARTSAASFSDSISAAAASVVAAVNPPANSGQGTYPSSRAGYVAPSASPSSTVNGQSPASVYAAPSATAGALPVSAELPAGVLPATGKNAEALNTPVKVGIGIAIFVGLIIPISVIGLGVFTYLLGYL